MPAAGISKQQNAINTLKKKKNPNPEEPLKDASAFAEFSLSQSPRTFNLVEITAN